ncbi:MAG: tRNA pseudouridine(38-40) synthase TruA [candidate division Zixibacteria bacterium]
MSRNIKLKIEYNGSDYSGWQYQPKQKTVQGEIERAIKKVISKKATLYVAGRTDAGVHARGQVANFRTESKLTPSKLRDALNFYLPNDILIVSAHEVPIDFHARYDAIYRHYCYNIAGERSAFDNDRTWLVRASLNRAALERAADYIIGDHDFASFCVSSSLKENNHCLIYHSRWISNKKCLSYEITADRFLHTMIRSLVGLMIEFARGAITFKRFKEIFHGGDHSALPRIAPALGLCLVEVEY